MSVKYSVFLCIMLISFSFSVHGLVNIDVQESCDNDDYVILQMSSEENAHAELFGGSGNYEYKLCYPPVDSVANSHQIISITPDEYSDEIRKCRGRNEVVSLFSESNSHVESPSNGLYDESACYGFFQNCRITTQTVDKTKGEVLVAYVSGQTNAHISSSQITGDNKLICEVPFCGSNQLGDMYPILFDFENEGALDDDVGDFKINNLKRDGSVSSGAVAEIVTNTSYPTVTGEKALVIDFEGTFTESRVNLYDLYKPDWAGFDYLEFYLVPLQSGALLMDIISQRDGTNITTSFDVSRHTPTKYERNKRNLIRIPLDTIGNLSNVVGISFYMDESLANYEAQRSDSFIMDTFILRSENPQTEFEEFYYCNGYMPDDDDDAVRGWTKNLDPYELSGNPVGGLTACTQSDLFRNGVIGATNSRCCGEQTGEIYADGSLGCYDGIVVDDGAVFDYVNYSINGEEITSFCDEDSCILAMPGVPDTGSPKYELSETSDSANVYFKESGNTVSNDIVEEVVVNLTKPRYAYGTLTNVTGAVGERVYEQSAEQNYFVCGSDNSLFLDDSLLETADSCTVVGDYYCTYDGFWSNDNSDVYGEITGVRDPANIESGLVTNDALPAKNRTKESVDFDDTSARGCCPENSCFHNGKCWADQSDFPSLGVPNEDGDGYVSSGDGKRCIAGEWEDQVPKQSLVGGDSGFCASESQCLISSSRQQRDNLVASCIDDGEYFQDYYCNDGNWSTRTILVANELEKEFGEGADKYRLYCDSFDKISNIGPSASDTDDDYSKLFLGTASEDFGGRKECDISFTDNTEEGCVNNVCVLVDNENKVYFGTSFNKNLRVDALSAEYKTPEEIFNSLDSSLGLDCSDVDEGEMQECDVADSDSGKWYYNNETKILLYSPPTSVWANIGNFFSRIGTAFTGLFGSTVDETLLPTQNIIQTLYKLQEQDDLQIVAFRVEDPHAPDEVSHVVLYDGASTQTINSMYTGLQTYADSNEDIIEVDKFKDDELLVTSNSKDSSDIWSRITVALR